MFQQLLSRSGLSPEPGAGQPQSAMHPAAVNTHLLASSHSAPEPSSRAASPVHTHSSRLRPSSASATFPNRPPLSQFEQCLSQAADASTHQQQLEGATSAEAGPSARQDGKQHEIQSLANIGNDSQAAASGHTSICEAVAAAQQQAKDAGEEQGMTTCCFKCHLTTCCFQCHLTCTLLLHIHVLQTCHLSVRMIRLTCGTPQLFYLANGTKASPWKATTCLQHPHVATLYN